MWEFVIGTLNLAGLPETIAVRPVSQRTHRETLKEVERMASQYSPASDCRGTCPQTSPSFASYAQKPQPGWNTSVTKKQNYRNQKAMLVHFTIFLGPGTMD